jgi:hypothetical protein
VHEPLPFVEHVAAPIGALDFVLDGLCQGRHVPAPQLAREGELPPRDAKIALGARVSRQKSAK